MELHTFIERGDWRLGLFGITDGIVFRVFRGFFLYKSKVFSKYIFFGKGFVS